MLLLLLARPLLLLLLVLLLLLGTLSIKAAYMRRVAPACNTWPV
jgi:hypothetical protein